MTVVCTFRGYRMIAGAAALIALLVAGGGQARQLANSAAKGEGRGKEAVALKEAYILMAGADHDYDGHRVEAMKRVEEAVKRLDHRIMRDGTNNQKIVATKDEIAAGRAKFIEKQQGKVYEGQALSDLQMREALQLIVKVREAAPLQKQPKVHEHVEEAIKHVEIALKIR
jgi:hypothetical protein